MGRKRGRGQRDAAAAVAENSAGGGRGGEAAGKGPQKRRRKGGPAGGAHVGEEESAAIVRALQQVDWGSVVNTGRKNVIDPARAPRNDKGKPFCQSFILGPNMKDPERKLSWFTEQNKELYNLLRRLMKRHDPAHVFTNITVNRNFLCKPHRDRGNSGPSYIVGFGDYTGGELNVGPRDRSGTAPGPELPKTFAAHDLRRHFVRFYGGEQTHWTNPFQGERFSCVFYNFPDLHAKGKILEQRIEEQLAADTEPTDPAASTFQQEGDRSNASYGDSSTLAPPPAVANRLAEFKARLGKKKGARRR